MSEVHVIRAFADEHDAFASVAVTDRHLAHDLLVLVNAQRNVGSELETLSLDDPKAIEQFRQDVES